MKFKGVTKANIVNQITIEDYKNAIFDDKNVNNKCKW